MSRLVLFVFILFQLQFCLINAIKYDFITTWGGNFVSNATKNPKFSEPSLKTLCSKSPQFSKVHIYAVNAHYGFKGYPGMTLGNHCTTSAFGSNVKTPYTLLQCPAIALDILYCQKRGVKVLITVVNQNSYVMKTDEEGEQLAIRMWNLFLGGNDSHRPFGDVCLDGVDLMIRDDSAGYLEYAQTLRTLMDGDNSKDYLLSISPSASFNDSYAGPGLRGTALSDPNLFDYICLFAMSSPDASVKDPAQFWQSITKWKDWLEASGATRPSLYLALPAAEGVPGVASPGDFLSVNRLVNNVFVNNLKTFHRLKGILIFDYSIDSAYLPCQKSSKHYSELFFQAVNSKLPAQFNATPNKNPFKGKRGDGSDDSDDDDFEGDDEDDDSPFGPKMKKGVKNGPGVFGGPNWQGQDSSAVNPFKSLRLGYFVLIVLACLMF